MNLVISWFEIPTYSLDRAAAFYSHVLNTPVEPTLFGGMRMAFFPNEPDIVSGALIEHPDAVPSPYGTTVYFYRPDDFDETLYRVVEAGGQILMPRTKVSEDVGSVAYFLDTEGNKVALHTSD
ncbi:MAG: VOC family protein [Sphingobacteriales bacterium]|nr:MAG: VOC family protein [Sphingobacteriales bacterium]